MFLFARCSCRWLRILTKHSLYRSTLETFGATSRDSPPPGVHAATADAGKHAVRAAVSGRSHIFQLTGVRGKIDIAVSTAN